MFVEGKMKKGRKLYHECDCKDCMKVKERVRLEAKKEERKKLEKVFDDIDSNYKYRIVHITLDEYKKLKQRHLDKNATNKKR
jgi:hypothetical protein